MISADMRLVIAALTGIILAVLMIVRGRLHPFIGLLCGAFTVGLLAGLPLPDVAKAVQKGVGDIVGGTGLVVALGLSLGAMLHISGAAASLAKRALQLTGVRAASAATLREPSPGASRSSAARLTSKGSVCAWTRPAPNSKTQETSPCKRLTLLSIMAGHFHEMKRELLWIWV